MQFSDDTINLKILEFAMNQYPHSYNFYHLYAIVLTSIDENKKAIEYYRKGLEIYKNFPDENEQFLKWIKEAPEDIKELEEIIKKQK